MHRSSGGGVFRTVAKRLGGHALRAGEDESRRRHSIGGEGRAAQDVIRAVAESEPIWSLLAEKDLPADLTLRELDAIGAALRGSPAGQSATDTVVSASLMFADPARIIVLQQIISSDLLPLEITGYRYATLARRGHRGCEPFVVALHSHAPGVNTVAASMLVAATFLRYELELGMLSADAVGRLEILVGMDLKEIVRTRQLLLDA
jgi:hypothetical protein